MINKKRLIRLVQALIRINSENPPGNESSIAGFIKDYFSSFGTKAKIYEFAKNRSNIIASLEGRDKKRSLLITPHLDTVPAGKNWHFDPFAAGIRGNKIYGLGASDCKGNLACAIETVHSLIEQGVALNYTLVFAATADEESGSDLGLIPLLDRGILRPDAAVVLDSDDYNIIIAQKGLLHVKVKLQGRRAHAAYPWKGVNAIDIAVAILKDLKSHRFSGMKNAYLKAPTMNIGTIKGGDKVNIVADWCEFELDFRFLPGMSETTILKYLKSTSARYSRKYKIEIEGVQKPYEIKRRHPLVIGLVKAMRKIKVKPMIKGSEGATVISFFQQKGIPAVATGFGCESCAHSIDEYARIDNLYRGAQALEEFLKNYSPAA